MLGTMPQSHDVLALDDPPRKRSFRKGSTGEAPVADDSAEDPSHGPTTPLGSALRNPRTLQTALDTSPESALAEPVASKGTALTLHAFVASPTDPRMAPSRSKSRLFGFLKPSRRLTGVLSVAELEREFERERARVDRNDHCFSVVVFLPESQGLRDLRPLAKLLQDRCRVEDVVGELDHHRLAALLPETNAEGAWIFAEDVSKQLLERKLACKCLVHTYPNPESQDDRRSGSGDAQDQGETSQEQKGDSPTDDSRTEVASVAGEIAVAAERTTSERYPLRLTLTEEEARRLERLNEVQGRPVADLTNYFQQKTPFWKRAMDVLVSGSLLLLLSPILLLAALATRLSSPGPIIFCQQRAGIGGKPFTIYKFRSMYIDAEERRKELEDQNELDGPVFKIKNDPRLTPVGRFMRRSSIDELPQLWNVLRGDMTLVGPRPPMLNEVADYEPWQLRRLHAKGGLTCIWQVSGRSEIGFEDWIRMDLRYVQKRNFLMDMDLLRRTAGAVFSGRGAY